MNATATFLSLLTLTSAVVVAADTPGSVALQRERRLFERERMAAIQPVVTRYIIKLEALRKSATQAGDLQGALAVQREIDTVTATKKKELFADRKFRFQRTIPGTPFLTLSPDGSISGSDHPNETTWDIDSAGHLVFKNRDGRITSIYTRERFAGGLLRLDGNSTDSKKGALVLEEVKE